MRIKAKEKLKSNEKDTAKNLLKMRKKFLKEIKNLNTKIEEKKSLYKNKEMGNTYNLLMKNENILNKFGNELNDEKLNSLEKDLNIMISNNNKINKIFNEFNKSDNCDNIQNISLKIFNSFLIIIKIIHKIFLKTFIIHFIYFWINCYILY